jgi:uncharacterized protein involved in outer membrane biogenesis
MKWAKRIGIGFAALLAILLVLPFFISLNDYIPRIEKEASARLGEPVSIKSLTVSLLPLPHLTVDSITVGKTQDITIGKVTVAPELLSLVASVKVIRTIEINGLVLTQKALDKIPVWTKVDPKVPQQPAQVRVESIRLDDALVKFDRNSFGPFDAVVKLTHSGEPETASIVTRDGKLKVNVKPEKSTYLIEALAKGWQLPLGPPILFDELAVKGVATLTDANFNDVRARLYGGSVAGAATVAWKKGIQLRGKAAVNQVEIRSLLQALGRPATMSGRLSANPVFSATAPVAGQLANALRLETPFEVKNGVLYGMDITKAATSLISKEGSKGGETRFDQLSGHLALDRGTRRLTQLKISSGSLAADGNVTISPRDELSGRVNAQVRVAGTSAVVPLNVMGSVQSPLLLPTGGTLAGAAVGTAILGPGLGTSTGAKVGGWVEGLFGKKEEPKK